MREGETRARINSLHVPEIICKFGQKTKRAAYEWNIKKEVHMQRYREEIARVVGLLSLSLARTRSQSILQHDTAIWVSY
jgi:hypothetical protein